MKKYTKPMIVFESFTLSTNIANTCEITDSKDSQLMLPGVFDDEGKPIYIFSAYENCGEKVDLDANDEGEYQGLFNTICYHNPTVELNFFGS